MRKEINYFINIIIVFVVFSFILFSAISYRYETHFLEKEANLLKELVLDEYKKRLKESVTSTIKFIENINKHNQKEHNNQNNIEEITREYLYTNIYDKTRYTWINKIVDFDGGENYAIRLIHPNLKDTEGSFLSTKSKDIKGNSPYLDELEGIKKDGEVYFTYFFKQIDKDKITEKLSFAMLYKELNWIIVSGIPINTLDEKVNEKKERLYENFKLDFIVRISIGFIVLSFLIFIIIKLKNKLSDLYEESVKEKDLKIIEQTKLAQIGGMIANISHQWKQPLNTISTISTGTKMQKEMDILTDEVFFESMDKINENVKYLSDTIDVFRNFIKEKKELQEVILQERIDKALAITSISLNSNHIELRNNIDYSNPIEIELVLGELAQVVINIINNAKDVLREREIEEPWIQIDLEKRKDIVLLTFEDNGGGIDNKVMPKIFDKYFTTKDESKGTGLGLHMSKKIVEDSLNGKLYAKNSENGAKFYLELPLGKNA